LGPGRRHRDRCRAVVVEHARRTRTGPRRTRTPGRRRGRSGPSRALPLARCQRRAADHRAAAEGAQVRTHRPRTLRRHRGPRRPQCRPARNAREIAPPARNGPKRSITAKPVNPRNAWQNARFPSREPPPMRLSQFHLHTSKETPAEAEIVSHKLMLKAGMIRKLAAGLYTWSPLGLRVLRKVERAVREEMDAAGAVELLMPTIQPQELWEE